MNAVTAYALAELLRQFPGLRNRIYPATGSRRQFLMMLGRARWRHHRPEQLQLFPVPARPGPKQRLLAQRPAPWVVVAAAGKKTCHEQ